MNKDNAAQYLPFVQALADGKTLQMCTGNPDNNYDWQDTDDPGFGLSPDRYRIKSESWQGGLWVKPGAKTYCAETTCFPDSSYIAQGYRKIQAVEKP